MSRKKGSGATKTNDPVEQDSLEIRDRLHAGWEPLQDKCALPFIHWRSLIAQRNDCAKRLNAGEGDKWTRKRLGHLEREIDEEWRYLGAALGAIKDADLPDKLATLAKAVQPAVHAWQAEAARQIEYAYLLEGSDSKVLPLLFATRFRNEKGQTITVRGKVNITAQKLYDHLRTQGYTMSIHGVRRFLRDTLQVTLRSEQGKRPRDDR
jgi:hypothetical protein